MGGLLSKFRKGGRAEQGGPPASQEVTLSREHHSEPHLLEEPSKGLSHSSDTLRSTKSEGGKRSTRDQDVQPGVSKSDTIIMEPSTSTTITKSKSATLKSEDGRKSGTLGKGGTLKSLFKGSSKSATLKSSKSTESKSSESIDKKKTSSKSSSKSSLEESGNFFTRLFRRSTKDKRKKKKKDKERRSRSEEKELLVETVTQEVHDTYAKDDQNVDLTTYSTASTVPQDETTQEAAADRSETRPSEIPLLDSLHQGATRTTRDDLHRTPSEDLDERGEALHKALSRSQEMILEHQKLRQEFLMSKTVVITSTSQSEVTTSHTRRDDEVPAKPPTYGTTVSEAGLSVTTGEAPGQGEDSTWGEIQQTHSSTFATGDDFVNVTATPTEKTKGDGDSQRQSTELFIDEQVLESMGREADAIRGEAEVEKPSPQGSTEDFEVIERVEIESSMMAPGVKYEKPDDHYDTTTSDLQGYRFQLQGDIPSEPISLIDEVLGAISTKSTEKTTLEYEQRADMSSDAGFQTVADINEPSTRKILDGDEYYAEQPVMKDAQELFPKSDAENIPQSVEEVYRDTWEVIDKAAVASMEKDTGTDSKEKVGDQQISTQAEFEKEQIDVEMKTGIITGDGTQGTDSAETWEHIERSLGSVLEESNKLEETLAASMIASQSESSTQEEAEVDESGASIVLHGTNLPELQKSLDHPSQVIVDEEPSHSIDQQGTIDPMELLSSELKPTEKSMSDEDFEKELQELERMNVSATDIDMSELLGKELKPTEKSMADEDFERELQELESIKVCATHTDMSAGVEDPTTRYTGTEQADISEVMRSASVTETETIPQPSDRVISKEIGAFEMTQSQQSELLDTSYSKQAFIAEDIQESYNQVQHSEVALGVTHEEKSQEISLDMKPEGVPSVKSSPVTDEGVSDLDTLAGSDDQSPERVPEVSSQVSSYEDLLGRETDISTPSQEFIDTESVPAIEKQTDMPIQFDESEDSTPIQSGSPELLITPDTEMGTEHLPGVEIYTTDQGQDTTADTWREQAQVDIDMSAGRIPPVADDRDQEVQLLESTPEMLVTEIGSGPVVQDDYAQDIESQTEFGMYMQPQETTIDVRTESKDEPQLPPDISLESETSNIESLASSVPKSDLDAGTEIEVQKWPIETSIERVSAKEDNEDIVGAGIDDIQEKAIELDEETSLESGAKVLLPIVDDSDQGMGMDDIPEQPKEYENLTEIDATREAVLDTFSPNLGDMKITESEESTECLIDVDKFDTEAPTQDDISMQEEMMVDIATESHSEPRSEESEVITSRSSDSDSYMHREQVIDVPSIDISGENMTVTEAFQEDDQKTFEYAEEGKELKLDVEPSLELQVDDKQTDKKLICPEDPSAEQTDDDITENILAPSGVVLQEDKLSENVSLELETSTTIPAPEPLSLSELGQQDIDSHTEVDLLTEVESQSELIVDDQPTDPQLEDIGVVHDDESPVAGKVMDTWKELPTESSLTSTEHTELQIATSPALDHGQYSAEYVAIAEKVPDEHVIDSCVPSAESSYEKSPETESKSGTFDAIADVEQEKEFKLDVAASLESTPDIDKGEVYDTTEQVERYEETIETDASMIADTREDESLEVASLEIEQLPGIDLDEVEEPESESGARDTFSQNQIPGTEEKVEDTAREAQIESDVSAVQEAKHELEPSLELRETKSDELSTESDELSLSKIEQEGKQEFYASMDSDLQKEELKPEVDPLSEFPITLEEVELKTDLADQTERYEDITEKVASVDSDTNENEPETESFPNNKKEISDVNIEDEQEMENKSDTEASLESGTQVESPVVAEIDRDVEEQEAVYSKLESSLEIRETKSDELSVESDELYLSKTEKSPESEELSLPKLESSPEEKETEREELTSGKMERDTELLIQDGEGTPKDDDTVSQTDIEIHFDSESSMDVNISDSALQSSILGEQVIETPPVEFANEESPGTDPYLDVKERPIDACMGVEQDEEEKVYDDSSLEITPITDKDVVEEYSKEQTGTYDNIIEKDAVEVTDTRDFESLEEIPVDLEVSEDSSPSQIEDDFEVIESPIQDKVIDSQDNAEVSTESITQFESTTQSASIPEHNDESIDSLIQEKEDTEISHQVIDDSPVIAEIDDAEQTNRYGDICDIDIKEQQIEGFPLSIESPPEIKDQELSPEGEELSPPISASSPEDEPQMVGFPVSIESPQEIKDQEISPESEELSAPISAPSPEDEPQIEGFPVSIESPAEIKDQHLSPECEELSPPISASSPEDEPQIEVFAPSIESPQEIKDQDLSPESEELSAPISASSPEEEPQIEGFPVSIESSQEIKDQELSPESEELSPSISAPSPEDEPQIEGFPVSIESPQEIKDQELSPEGGELSAPISAPSPEDEPQIEGFAPSIESPQEIKDQEISPESEELSGGQFIDETIPSVESLSGETSTESFPDVGKEAFDTGIEGEQEKEIEVDADSSLESTHVNEKDFVEGVFNEQIDICEDAEQGPIADTTKLESVELQSRPEEGGGVDAESLDSKTQIESTLQSEFTPEMQYSVEDKPETSAEVTKIEECPVIEKETPKDDQSPQETDRDFIQSTLKPCEVKQELYVDAGIADEDQDVVADILDDQSADSAINDTALMTEVIPAGSLEEGSPPEYKPVLEDDECKETTRLPGVTDGEEIDKCLEVEEPCESKTEEDHEDVEAGDSEPPSFAVQDFVWEHGGQTVTVSGTFNDWTEEPMTESGGVHRLSLQLPVGKYLYRYTVDGETMANPMEDVEGELNVAEVRTTV